MYKGISLERTISEMKSLGETLIPYNYPKDTAATDDEIFYLKLREIIVDGYFVTIFYQKADFDSHYMESFQVYGRNSPFLPFSLVCKLAKKFLGSQELSLVEVYKDNRKIYCWSVCTDKDGKVIPSPYEVEVEKCSYEGFNYLYMEPNQVNFF
jgi:hypothetical protein